VPFPFGVWNVFRPEPTENIEMAPFFIPTSAHQLVQCMGALEPFDDYGYGIHYDALYEQTFGCLHLYSAADAQWLAEQINAVLNSGDLVQLMVGGSS
jgi:hypothetical protein